MNKTLPSPAHPIGRISMLWQNVRQHIRLSLNDPQWGRKPDNNADDKGAAPPPAPTDTPAPTSPPPAAPTPPSPSPNPSSKRPQGQSGNQSDLDELLKKMNERMTNMFGGKSNKTSDNRRPPNNNGGNNGGPKMPQMSPQAAASSLLVVAIIGALVWLASGFYIVDEGKRGIVQRFGKYVETTEPGPRWHWPWPIERRTMIDLNAVRSKEIGFRGAGKGRDGNKQAQMLTEDLNIIDISFAVQYTLSDARAFLFNNRDPEGAVVQAAETAMREIVGKRKMDFLLNQGREESAGAAQKLMQQLLDRYGTGITISKLNLQAVAAPEAVNEAFQDVVKAQQDRDRQVNEGQAYANRIIPEAKGKVARLLEEAAGYEQSVATRAEGDAARFTSIVAEYQKAPGVTRDRLYIDMMQSVLSNTSKVFVDQKAGQSLLYLPLDKLMAQTREAANAAVNAASTATTTTTAPPLSEPAKTAPNSVEVPSSNAVSPRDLGRPQRESR